MHLRGRLCIKDIAIPIAHVHAYGVQSSTGTAFGTVSSLAISVYEYSLRLV